MTQQPPDDIVEHVLEESLKRVRQQPVPTMPAELLQPKATEQLVSEHSVAEASSDQNRWRLAGMVAAASVVVAVGCWTLLQWSETQQSSPVAEDSSIVITNEPIPLADFKPFASLEKNLDQMETEIADLRKEAELLDATRKINSMMVMK